MDDVRDRKPRFRRALALAIVALASACALLPAGPTVATLPAGDGFPAVPVVLDDSGGLVGSVAVASIDPGWNGPTGVSRTGPSSVVLTWTGGACDSRVRLAASMTNGIVHVGLRTDQAGSSCNAAGIGRAVTISFVDGVDVATVALDPGQ